MRLSTRARYGTLVMMELAASYGKGAVILKNVARKQQLPARYLENLMTPLRDAGLVRTHRGIRGGFALARHPSQVKLSEVVELLEGTVTPVHCVDDPGDCKRSASCVARDVWARVKEAVMGVLDSITLEDLVRMQEARRKAWTNTYEI